MPKPRRHYPLSQHLIDQIDAEAERLGVQKSTVVELALELYFRRKATLGERVFDNQNEKMDASI